jgi:hypothetical protein
MTDTPTLGLMCPSMGSHEPAVDSWITHMTTPHTLVSILKETIGPEAGFLSKCQRFHVADRRDIQGYLHSDLIIHEQGWDARVLREFHDSTVAVVGFVGAQGLAHDDIYKIPYDYTQLARFDVTSNLTDADVHGSRDAAGRRVAVIDSCAVLVCRSFLAGLGGWPIARYPDSSHCSDLWLCSMAHRHGMCVRMVGVSCTHLSGGKGEAGSRWLEAHGTDQGLHRRAHELIYDDFRDLLPLRVAP